MKFKFNLGVGWYKFTHIVQYVHALTDDCLYIETRRLIALLTNKPDSNLSPLRGDKK